MLCDRGGKVEVVTFGNSVTFIDGAVVVFKVINSIVVALRVVGGTGDDGRIVDVSSFVLMLDEVANTDLHNISMINRRILFRN